MNKKFVKKNLFLIFSVLFLFSAPLALADEIGDEKVFFIDPFHDENERSETRSVLQAKNSDLYLYLDKEWWGSLDYSRQKEINSALLPLASTFTQEIYPGLTQVFGKEWRLGIDGNRHITVLMHPLKPEVGGYTRPSDEYQKSVVADSNEREMLYLGADFVDKPIAPSYLAHEFMHLITFNQKDRLRGVGEERWLNELRAEYGPSLLGFDKSSFENSNLKQRIDSFLSFPSDSLTEWKNEKADYGVVNLFGQYLVEQYGVEILADSLHSEKTGIKSLNQFLKESGYEEEVSDLFLNFVVAVYANDCTLGKEYCFQNKYLEDIKVTPQVNFLPLKGTSSLGVSQKAKSWEGNWYKFTGGRKGALKIQFMGNPDNEFKVAYLVRDFTGQYSLSFLELSEDQRGKILVPGLGTDVSSVTMMPVVVTKKSDFTSNEEEISFFWEATTITEEEELEKEKNGNGSSYLQRPVSEMGRGEVLAKIEELEVILEQLRAQLAFLDGEGVEEDDQGSDEREVSGEATSEGETAISCQSIQSSLRAGMSSQEVVCLQEFLKSQEQSIYPEGLITGYFGPLTEAAVIRFQEKYQEEVLAPWDLDEGTGFVGETTRQKINELI